MRSERYNTPEEIKHNYKNTRDPSAKAAAVFLFEGNNRYGDDGSSHIKIEGSTGMGKSEYVNSFIRECLNKGESIIVTDPKGEFCYRNACFIPDGYKVYNLDFRHPRTSATKFNPLAAILKLFRSDSLDDQDIASGMVSELWRAVYPIDSCQDTFWPESAASLLIGLSYVLLEMANVEEVTLDSIAAMLECSEQKCGGSFLIKELYELLPHNSMAKHFLSSYANSPQETRLSTHAVAESSFRELSQSRGVMDMLSRDTLDILNIDVFSPFVIFIQLPDEHSTYSKIAGILISQITQHLIRVAQDQETRMLPIRVNCILEELSSVGKSISNLDNLCAASRSRNIRLVLILQSDSQMEDIFGKCKAESINSCIGTSICFSTNDYKTLTEWSQRCGEKEVEINGQIIREPLISPAQLGAMPVGSALIFAQNRFKFITHFPLYDEAYDNSMWKPPEYESEPLHNPSKTFDLKQSVFNLKERKIDRMYAHDEKQSHNNNPFGFPIWENDSRPSPPKHKNEMDTGKLIRTIEKRVAELEAEEKVGKNRKQTNPKDKEDQQN